MQINSLSAQIQGIKYFAGSICASSRIITLFAILCSFLHFDYGYRAALLLMRNYVCRYGCDTPEKIIRRWAPPSENDTELYIACVCGRSRLLRNERIRPEGMQIPRLVAAMAKQETGLHPVPEYLEELRRRFGV